MCVNSTFLFIPQYVGGGHVWRWVGICGVCGGGVVIVWMCGVVFGCRGCRGCGVDVGVCGGWSVGYCV